MRNYFDVTMSIGRRNPLILMISPMIVCHIFGASKFDSFFGVRGSNEKNQYFRAERVYVDDRLFKTRRSDFDALGNIGEFNIADNAIAGFRKSVSRVCCCTGRSTKFENFQNVHIA